MAELRWKKNVGSVEIVKLSVGRMDNNVYVIRTDENAFVVDAGSAEPDAVLAELGDRTFDAVLQTHNHGDHIATLREVVEATKAPVFAHPSDAIPVKAVPLEDGASVSLGGETPVNLTVLHTPGHTPGGVCFLLQEEGEAHLFAGDTLFPGGPGNTFGNADDFKTIIRSLEEKLFVLDDATHVYPGHGNDTTIGAERPHLEEWRARGF